MGYSKEERSRIFQALGYECWRDTKSFGRLYYPVPEVMAFHDSPAKIKIALAPARTGKSYGGAHDIIPDILDFDDPGKHLIVGPDYDKAGKEFGYIADALVHRRKEFNERLGVELPEPLEYQFKPKSGRMSIVWPWGAELHAKSAVHFNSVIGESWKTAVLAEACEIPAEIFYRGLRTRTGRFIIPTTPGLKGLWVKELWDDAQKNEDHSVALFSFPPHSNPLYDMERFNEELKRCGPEDPYFREQFLGEWVFYGGRVFPSFQPEPVERLDEIAVREWGRHPSSGDVCVELDPLWIPQQWKRVGGMDFGWADATVLLWAAVAPNGDVIVYDEYYQRQRSTEHHARDMHAMSRRNGTVRFDDILREPKGPAASMVSREYSQHGLHNRGATNADRISSRLHMQAYLDKRADTGLPSLRIVKSRCPNLVRELIGLHYEDPTDQPREGRVERWKGEDHATDACRYLLSSRPAPRRITDSTEEYAYTLERLRKERRRHVGTGQIGWRQKIQDFVLR